MTHLRMLYEIIAWAAVAAAVSWIVCAEPKPEPPDRKRRAARKAAQDVIDA